jgi:hypothetical protein
MSSDDVMLISSVLRLDSAVFAAVLVFGEQLTKATTIKMNKLFIQV